jgi:hypothetical protein
MMHRFGDMLRRPNPESAKIIGARLGGYAVVVVSTLIVTNLLRKIFGEIPGPPTQFAGAVLLVSVLLSMCVFRQTIAKIEQHAAQSSERAAKNNKGQETSVVLLKAQERQWRFRTATVWVAVAALVLMLYVSMMTFWVRSANDPEQETGQTRVIVPPILPPETRDYLKHHTIDYILTHDPNHFTEKLPNEDPMYLLTAFVPLYAVYILFCVLVAKSLGYTIARMPKVGGIGENVSATGGGQTPDGQVLEKADEYLADQFLGLADQFGD